MPIAIAVIWLRAVANGFTIIVTDAIAVTVAIWATGVLVLAILVFVTDWVTVVFANAVTITIAILAAVVGILTVLVFITNGFAILVVGAGA
ncbi:MAG: hypothetical protein KC434_17830, partial [Anaerolineales bacterium]|nr:hypothetical protein [Anaerolineales bacterium]